jgi:signal transduction histidine kinase
MILTVADTGAGMRPEVLRRVFEPFFSTKESAGTGLGLWVSLEIARRHGGSLTVRSRTTEGSSGTTFRLFLPANAVER